MADPLSFSVEVSPGVIESLGRQASGTIKKLAFDIEGEMKRLMSLPKSGRFYKVSKRGALHQASAPGEAPAVDTGNLRAGIKTDEVTPILFEVRVAAEYASYLEYGTRRMLPRPYVAPAIETIKSRNEGILGRVRR